MALFDAVSKKVRVKNVHLDKKSFEKSTGRTKCKYKLAGNPIKELDQFFFFILAGELGAYHKALTVKVGSDEWINRNPQHPSRLGGLSHIDITRYEVLTSREVGKKIIEKNNGFHFIAELPQSKFIELQGKLLKLKFMYKPVSAEVRGEIALALQVTSDDIMRRLGI